MCLISRMRACSFAPCPQLALSSAFCQYASLACLCASMLGQVFCSLRARLPECVAPRVDLLFASVSSAVCAPVLPPWGMAEEVQIPVRGRGEMRVQWMQDGRSDGEQQQRCNGRREAKSTHGDGSGGRRGGGRQRSTHDNETERSTQQATPLLPGRLVRIAAHSAGFSNRVRVSHSTSQSI